MKVILLQDIRGKGKKGQMIEASDGYARNFLLPRKMAIEATADNINTMKMNDKAKAEQMAREKAQAQDFAARLKEVTVEIPAKAGTGGRLFGSVTAKDVADALEKQAGIKVDKKKVQLKDGIKNAGAYQVEIRLHPAATAKVSVQVDAQ